MDMNIKRTEFSDKLGNTVERERQTFEKEIFINSASHLPLKGVFIEHSARALVYSSGHSYLKRGCIILGD